LNGCPARCAECGASELNRKTEDLAGLVQIADRVRRAAGAVIQRGRLLVRRFRRLGIGKLAEIDFRATGLLRGIT